MTSLELAALVEELLQRHRAPERGGQNEAATGRVDLDDLEEVIGPRAISYEEVEALISRLEDEGLRVGDQLAGRDVDLIRRVVGAATRLQSELGRRPQIEEIAREEGIPTFAVRRSLEQARRTVRG